MVILTGEGASERLNVLAREQMKLKLLNDIRVDLLICELEGWNKNEYLDDLREMLDGLGNGRTGTS